MYFHKHLRMLKILTKTQRYVAWMIQRTCWLGRLARAEKGGCPTDEDKWGYLDLDKMATKDVQVKIYVTPK